MQYSIRIISFYIFVLGWACAASAATNKQNLSLSPYSYEKLQEAQAKINEDAYLEAENLLQTLYKKDKNTYAQVLSLQMLGHIALLQEQYAKAKRQFSQALAMNVLPAAEAENLVINLSQLYLADEEWPATVSLLQDWRVQNPEVWSAQLAFNLGAALALQGQHRLAIPPLEEAIKRAKAYQAAENSPQPNDQPPAAQRPGDKIAVNRLENWHLFLINSLYETKRYPKAVVYLKQMIAQFAPKKNYWLQLASMHLMQEQTEQALAVLQLAHQQGLLDQEQEILQLSGSLMREGLPYQAGRLMEAGLANGRLKAKADNYELLSQSWQLAKETDKAIASLKQAAQLSSDGEQYLQLGQLHWAKRQFKPAREYMRLALNRQLKDKGTAYLLMAMVHFELKDRRQALANLQLAMNFDNSRKDAERWYNYLIKL